MRWSDIIRGTGTSSPLILPRPSPQSHTPSKLADRCPSAMEISRQQRLPPLRTDKRRAAACFLYKESPMLEGTDLEQVMAPPVPVKARRPIPGRGSSAFWALAGACQQRSLDAVAHLELLQNVRHVVLDCLFGQM
jgi:hypothetical protein